MIYEVKSKYIRLYIYIYIYIYIRTRGYQVAYFTPGRVGLGSPGLEFLCLIVYLSVCLSVCRGVLASHPPRVIHPGRPTLGDPH